MWQRMKASPTLLVHFSLQQVATFISMWRQNPGEFWVSVTPTKPDMSLHFYIGRVSAIWRPWRRCLSAFNVANLFQWKHDTIFNVKVTKKYLDRWIIKFPDFHETREYSAFKVSSRYRESLMRRLRLMSALYVVTLSLSSNQSPVLRSRDPHWPIRSLLSRLWPPAPTVCLFGNCI